MCPGGISRVISDPESTNSSDPFAAFLASS